MKCATAHMRIYLHFCVFTIQNRRGESRNARPFRSRSRGSSQPPRLPCRPPPGRRRRRPAALPGDRNELRRFPISIGISPLPAFCPFRTRPRPLFPAPEQSCRQSRARHSIPGKRARPGGRFEALHRQNRGLFAVPAERKRSARTGNVSVKGTAVWAVFFFFHAPHSAARRCPPHTEPSGRGCPRVSHREKGEDGPPAALCQPPRQSPAPPSVSRMEGAPGRAPRASLRTDLPALVTIISVPSWLNSSHSAFISSCTLTLATFGFFFTGALAAAAVPAEQPETAADPAAAPPAPSGGSGPGGGGLAPAAAAPPKG